MREIGIGHQYKKTLLFSIAGFGYTLKLEELICHTEGRKTKREEGEGEGFCHDSTQGSSQF